MASTTLEIRTLTPIWTGDADGKCTEIKETGIIGSMRWWYEAIVRGMGGYACDPTSSDSCKFDTDRYENALENGKNIENALAVGLKKVCPACRLFGCTGWRRRFRAEIENIDGNFSTGINGGFEGVFEFKMCETGTISGNDRWLLYQTLKIIDRYGAISGRTTRKPQRGPIGQNYGLINVYFGDMSEWSRYSDYTKVKEWIIRTKEDIDKTNDESWFNFGYYWIVKDRHIDRINMNKLMGLDENGKPIRNDDFCKFLRGKEGVSKKIFSFNKPEMVFGYVRNEEELDKIADLLKIAFNSEEVQIEKGADILVALNEVDDA